METDRVKTNQTQWNLMVTVVTFFSADDAYGICLTSMRTIVNAKMMQPVLRQNRINQRQVLIVLAILTFLLHCPDWLKVEWNELTPIELAQECLRMSHLVLNMLSRCGFLPLHPDGSLHVAGEEVAKETQHPSSERAATGQTDGYGASGSSHQQPGVSLSVPGQKLDPDVTLMNLIVDMALQMKESEINLNQLTNLLAWVDYQCGNKYKEQVMRLLAPRFKKGPELPQGQSIVINNNNIGTQIGTVSSGATGVVNLDKK